MSACFADEGTTIKRWRPRARGRATRIRKRTSHITVIVSRLPEEQLAAARRPGAGPSSWPGGPAGSPVPAGPRATSVPGRAPPRRRRSPRTTHEADDPRSTRRPRGGRGRGSRRTRPTPRRGADERPEVTEAADGDRRSGGRTTAETADGGRQPRPLRSRSRPPTIEDEAAEAKRPTRISPDAEVDSTPPEPTMQANEEKDELDGSEGQPVRVPPRASPPTGSRAGSTTATTRTTSSRTGRSATT